jgi:predicted nucleotidyltransferase
MVDQTLQRPLTQFVKAISQKVRVEEVVIFGSYLEGNPRADSDIDIIVISDDFKKMDENSRLDMLYRASEDIMPEIHPWAFTSDELKKASSLTTWGYARDNGIQFSQHSLN